MTDWNSESSGSKTLPADKIVFADMSRGQPADLKFPLDFVRDKTFLTGMTGSGKSWTAGLLMEEINRVANQTQYNGQTVLDGSLAEAGGNPGGQIQVGTEAGQSVGFSINSVDTDALALSTGGASDIDVSDATNASDSLALITSAIEQVAGDRAAYGALQNRLEYTVSNLLNVAEYTTAARSRIADADFAAESARLAKAQVLQQSGTAMLAQANASSQLALSLFR